MAGRRFYIGPLPNNFSQRSRDLTNLGEKPYRHNPESKFPRLPCSAVSRDESRGLVVAVQFALEAKKQNYSTSSFLRSNISSRNITGADFVAKCPCICEPQFFFWFLFCKLLVNAVSSIQFSSAAWITLFEWFLKDFIVRHCLSLLFSRGTVIKNNRTIVSWVLEYLSDQILSLISTRSNGTIISNSKQKKFSAGKSYLTSGFVLYTDK